MAAFCGHYVQVNSLVKCAPSDVKKRNAKRWIRQTFFLVQKILWLSLKSIPNGIYICCIQKCKKGRKKPNILVTKLATNKKNKQTNKNFVQRKRLFFAWNGKKSCFPMGGGSPLLHIYDDGKDKDDDDDDDDDDDNNNNNGTVWLMQKRLQGRCCSVQNTIDLHFLI